MAEIKQVKEAKAFAQRWHGRGYEKGDKDTFLNYLKSFYAANVRMGLKKLFKALDTPLYERDPYDESVKKFPYVNGGLFTGRHVWPE